MDYTTDLANIMIGIVDGVCECLETTQQEDIGYTGIPSFCGVYWNTPPDDLDCGDCGTKGALFVWMERMGASSSNWPAPWPGPASASPGPFTIPVPLAVRLIRPCWPVVGQPGVLTPFPSRDDTEDHAVALTVDASTVMCCLMDMIADKSAGSVFGQCGRITTPAITPDGNRGGCAGFTARFVIDLGACCTPTEETE